MTETEVFCRFKKRVYGLAKTLVSTDFDADDITSEVFIRYIRYIRSNNTFNDDQHLENWLMRVTRNLAYDQFRSDKRKRENEKKDELLYHIEQEINESKSDFVKSLERKLSYQEVMDKLSPRYREVLLLYFDYGYSIKEIALQLGQSESSVKTLLFRAKNKYKEISESVGDNNE